jgi:hypothetical protein
MKKLFLFLMLLAGISFAVETNYNEPVTRTEPWGAVVYSGTVTFSDSGNGDTYYTQTMLIGAVDKDYYGWIRVICSEVGTEDVNVFFRIFCRQFELDYRDYR